MNGVPTSMALDLAAAAKAEGVSFLSETEAREEETKDAASEDYIRRMKMGLNHWVDGGGKGYLTWGIFPWPPRCRDNPRQWP